VVQQRAQHLRYECLAAVAQRLLRVRVEVHQHRRRARHDPLRRCVEDVRQPVRRIQAGADAVRRVDAHRQPGLAAHDRDVGEVDEVAVRVTEVRLDAAQAEHDPGVALAGDVLARVERLLERDPHPALEQHRELLLPAHLLEQLVVLRVAGADLDHHRGRVTGPVERVPQLVELGRVGRLHRDQLDPVLPGQLEHPRKTLPAEPLEVVRRGARLVGAHAGRHDPLSGERGHHRVHVRRRVHRAQTGEHVDGAVVDAHAVVLEPDVLARPVVAADQPVLGRHAHHLEHARQLLERRRRHGGGRPDQVHLAEPVRRPLELVRLDGDARVARRGGAHRVDHRALVGQVGLEDDDHWRTSGRSRIAAAIASRWSPCCGSDPSRYAS